MEDRLRARLARLKAEYESGQRMLAELEAKRTHLTQTLLRIEGAIQVLDEALGERSSSTDEASRPGPG